MANEHTYSDAADLRVAQILNREVLTLLADMTDLRSVCRFVPHPLSGSQVIKTTQVQLAYTMAAPGEDTAPSNSAFVDSSFTLTPVRRSLKFVETDLVQITRPDGGLDVDAMARIAAGAYPLDFADALTALFTSLSTSVGGGAGVDFSVDNAFDAQFALNLANVPGPFTAVLKHNSFNEFQTSLRGESGALQFVGATAEMLSAKGPGYKGSWNGIDFYSTESVVENANVNENAMFGAGCFGYTEADVSKLTSQIDRRVAVQGSPLFVTTVWDDLKASWRIVANAYYAVGIAENARGVLINSDDV